MRLTQFDSAGFLRDHWQRRPLLIRDPWDAWANPLDPDELAGLACEEEVEARLVVHGRGGWQLEHGPFAEDRFAALPADPWTLLVQAADHLVPEVAALIEPFRFVPDWRIDDVMVSYASDGGGVGPHFDRYDVFLIQGQGQRRWQIGEVCDESSECLPHDDLRLLARFEPLEEWVLSPGDILYVPPGFAHNGVAVGDDCMTYSVGFRAPARSELLAHWCDHVLADLPADDRYTDAALAPQANPGEILPSALAALHAMASDKLLDRGAFARWFGQYNSRRKYPEIDWAPEEPVTLADLRAAAAADARLCRNRASRFSFIRQGADMVLLFVDGECFEAGGGAAAFAEELCLRECLPVTAAMLAPPVAAIVLTLCNQGSLALDNED